MENEAQVPTQFSLWVAGKPSAPLDLPMALGGDCFAIAKRESAIEVAQYVAMQFPESFRRVAVKPSDFFYHLGFNPEIQKVKLVFNGMVALAKACDAHQLRWEDVVIATTIAQGGPVRAPAQAQPVPGRTERESYLKSLLGRFRRGIARHLVAMALWFRSVS